MGSKYLFILEIVWVIIGVVSILAGIHNIVNYGGDKILIFILMTIIAFTMALFRHIRRKKS